MDRRLELHEILCEILGSRNVYFQPPSSVTMKYPAIRYSTRTIENRFADNGVYTQSRSYEVMVIDRDPDSAIAEKVSLFPTSRFDRSYTSDNLNHFVFTLYY